MLEACCVLILVIAVAARPAVPVLPGPWDAPGRTSLSLPMLPGPWNYPEARSSTVSRSVSSTLSSSLLTSISTSPSSNSLISTSRSSSSSLVSSSSGSGNSPVVIKTARSTQPPPTTSSTSVRSMTVKLSASSTGSSSNTSSVTGAPSTSLSIHWTIYDQTQSAKSVSLSSQSQRLPFSSASSLSPSSTVSGGQSQVASTSQSPIPTLTGTSNFTLSTSSSSSLNTSSVIATPSSIVSSAVSTSQAFVLSITRSSSASTVPKATATPNPCGPVAAYYSPTSKNWTDHNTDVWLNSWVTNNVGPIAANINGFTGAFGTWAIGDPGFNCQDDGALGNCDFDPCNNAMLNSKGDNIPQTYYVMQSAVGIHTYFTGLREAFTVSSIGAALTKDSWATTFYRDKDAKSVVALREIFNVLMTAVGIVAALCGVAGVVAGTIAAVGATLFNGVIGAFNPTLGQHADDTFKKSADLGRILGDIVIGTIESFTSANNILMHGGNYLSTGDLRDYWKGGAFVDYPGVDKNTVTDTMNSFLVGQAINTLYRQQKVFIMGGGACGDNQGIGQGPQAWSVCRDGKAWYLYWWQENDVISLTRHQWGWVNAPPGSDQLGKGDWANVTVQDIVNSSLDAYIVAGYKYTNVTAHDRAQQAITQQWINPATKGPAALGPAWEGIFTIPVCNVSQAVNSDYYSKQYILQDFGHESRPLWCGPVCDGDVQKTKDFIHAANMDNFQSPRHVCADDSLGAWWEGPLGT